MTALAPDPEFTLNRLERWMLEWLAVPAAPAPPEGSPDSIRVFRAGRKYYLWSVLLWAAATMAIGFGLLSLSLPLLVVIRRASGWPEFATIAALVLMWSVFILVAAFTFVSRRLNYGLRWYIVTDRSLRIRSGIFQVNELTMTYSNVQEIRVASGPLQNLLGIADVEVQAAGGGGGDRHGGGGHIGRFNGVSNANEIRDLIVDRLRQYRDSGLGEAHPSPSANGDEMAAARAMLGAARELRAVFQR